MKRRLPARYSRTAVTWLLRAIGRSAAALARVLVANYFETRSSTDTAARNTAVGFPPTLVCGLIICPVALLGLRKRGPRPRTLSLVGAMLSMASSWPEFVGAAAVDLFLALWIFAASLSALWGNGAPAFCWESASPCRLRISAFRARYSDTVFRGRSYQHLVRLIRGGCTIRLAALAEPASFCSLSWLRLWRRHYRRASRALKRDGQRAHILLPFTLD